MHHRWLGVAVAKVMIGLSVRSYVATSLRCDQSCAVMLPLHFALHQQVQHRPKDKHVQASTFCTTGAGAVVYTEWPAEEEGSCGQKHRRELCIGNRRELCIGEHKGSKRRCTLVPTAVMRTFGSASAPAFSWYRDVNWPSERPVLYTSTLLRKAALSSQYCLKL